MLVESITWHPVADGLPDADLTVNVATEGCEEPTWLGFHDGSCWRDVDGMEIKVTHWAEMLVGPSAAGVPAVGAPERFSVWEVCWGKSASALFATREEAERIASGGGASTAPSITERHVFGVIACHEAQGEPRDLATNRDGTEGRNAGAAEAGISRRVSGVGVDGSLELAARPVGHDPCRMGADTLEAAAAVVPAAPGVKVLGGETFSPKTPTGGKATP